MAGFEINEWIGHAPEEVFAFLTDSANAAKMSEKIIRFEKITESPVGIGTRYREVRLINGQEAESELEVTAYQPSQKYSVRNETEGVKTTYHYSLTPEQNGTRITLECDIVAGGLKKMVAPVLATILKKEDGEHLQQLKAVMG